MVVLARVSVPALFSSATKVKAPEPLKVTKPSDRSEPPVLASPVKLITLRLLNELFNELLENGTPDCFSTCPLKSEAVEVKRSVSMTINSPAEMI